MVSIPLDFPLLESPSQDYLQVIAIDLLIAFSLLVASSIPQVSFEAQVEGLAIGRIVVGSSFPIVRRIALVLH